MWTERPISDWLHRQVEFAPSRPISGPFDLRHSPYVAEPLAAVQNERNREMWMIASWQSVKSLWLELSALYLQANDGQAMIWNSPTDEKAAEFSDTRFSELLADCKPVTELLAGDRHSNTKSLKRFVHAWMLIQGAETLGNLQSKSVGYVLNDEGWLFKPGRIEEARARTTKFRRWLRLNATTAGAIHSGVKLRIDEEGNEGNIGPDETTLAWEASDKREWFLRCPTCRDFFAPKWKEHMDFGGKDCENDKGDLVLSRVKKNLRLVCPLCSARHAYSKGMLDELNIGAHYRVTKPENAGGIIAWHYNAICHFDWLQLAEEWIKANRAIRLGSITPLKMFVQRRLAETWDVNLHANTAAEVAVGGYKLREAWADEKFRFLTVDVQKDSFFCIVRAWGTKAVSRQIAVEHVPTIDAVEKLRLDLAVPPNRTFLDCAWNQQAVFGYCARFGYAGLNGVKSRSFYHAPPTPDQPGVHRIYSPARIQPVFIGTNLDRGQQVYEFLFSTQAINDRLDVLRGVKDPDPIWTVASDCPELFKRHMDACRRVERRDVRGYPYFEWVQVGSRPDHWRDCELMQVCMASMAGVVGSEAQKGQIEEKEAVAK